MAEFPKDIYTEPEDFDVDTLKNLGPLTGMAGIWQGRRGMDVNPKAWGPERQEYVEHMEMQPIDPQLNGPQLLYGLRYHTYIVKPGEVETYHDQVGYWLWEPATGTVTHTLTIPRGQVAILWGTVAADATEFELVTNNNLPNSGIASIPFLDHAFKTTEFRIRVKINSKDSWSYSELTVMQIKGLAEPFNHTDDNHLTKIGEPTPNPLMR